MTSGLQKIRHPSVWTGRELDLNEKVHICLSPAENAADAADRIDEIRAELEEGRGVVQISGFPTDLD